MQYWRFRVSIDLLTLGVIICLVTAFSSRVQAQDPSKLGTIGPVSGGVFAGDFADCAPFRCPPDIAADVNSIQAIEFDNLGMIVYSKVPSTKKLTPVAAESQMTFWCTGPNAKGSNGLPLLMECLSTSSITDTVLFSTLMRVKRVDGLRAHFH